MLYTPFEITETVKMFTDQHLDIRTITMGISLLDCISHDSKIARDRVYDKIMRKAGNLVSTAEKIEAEYGVPIINKRISVTPIALIGGATDDKDYVNFARTLDRAAKETGVDFLGGFSALVDKGFTKGDRILLDSIPEALAATERVCASVNLGSTRYGINMDAVKDMGHIIKKTAELTKDADGIGCAKLVVFCNAPGDNPFMAGAFHGVNEGDAVVSVGVSGPGVVKCALEGSKGEAFDVIADKIKKTSFKITRLGHMVATVAAERLGVPFGILDLSLAPTPAVGDSIARIFQEMGLEYTGCHGTTAALCMLNDAVKKGGIMASTHVGGLSGAFIPVTEDEGMVEALNVGALTLDKLEAMTCVCSVGLDMVPVPGDTPAETLSGMIADEAAIGMANSKTTAVRVIPVPGKTVGEWAEFGGLLGGSPIMAVNKFSSADFINRGGRIPAPVHSFKN
ncbi:MAG: PFL family protein [Spirochaetaceae bacterium]